MAVYNIATRFLNENIETTKRAFADTRDSKDVLVDGEYMGVYYPMENTLSVWIESTAMYDYNAMRKLMDRVEVVKMFIPEETEIVMNYVLHG